MRSRWCPSRSALSSTAAPSRRRVSRSAASRTSPGAMREAEAALRGQPANEATFAQAADLVLRDAKGFGAQHLQDRSGAPRHRPRAVAGGARHAAVAVQQEDRVSKPWHPISAPPHPASTASRRSPAPQNMPPSSTFPASPMRASSARRSPRAASRASTPARPCASKACSTVLTHENRPPMADNDRGLQGRGGSGRLAVPAAVRRQDHVQRPADRAGRRRNVGDRALRGVAGSGGIRDGAACHGRVSPARRGRPGEGSDKSDRGRCSRRRSRAARPTRRWLPPRCATRPNISFRSSITTRWSSMPRR